MIVSITCDTNTDASLRLAGQRMFQTGGLLFDVDQWNFDREPNKVSWNECFRRK